METERVMLLIHVTDQDAPYKVGVDEGADEVQVVGVHSLT